jgi:hypothetical protein
MGFSLWNYGTRQVEYFDFKIITRSILTAKQRETIGKGGSWKLEDFSIGWTKRGGCHGRSTF